VARCEIGTHPQWLALQRAKESAAAQLVALPWAYFGGDMAQRQLVAGEPVDLNQASAEELILLIGISESIAEGIIDFRDANGGFDRIEDLMEVECISEAWYQRIRFKVIV
jgi:competence ComEA-like helix-hairpin-helix protein